MTHALYQSGSGPHRNPLVLSLPPAIEQKNFHQAFFKKYSCKIDTLNAGNQCTTQSARLLDLESLNDVFFPFKIYEKVEILLYYLIRSSYKNRNPLSNIDVRWRNMVATRLGLSELLQARAALVPNSTQIPLLATWLGPIGVGKSTFLEQFCNFFPSVIEHSNFNGNALHLRQVPILKLRMPSSGTLKSLYFSLLNKIDETLLTTNYLSIINNARALHKVESIIVQVVTAISLGVLIIDEFQNAAFSGENNSAEIVEFLVQLAKVTGTSIFLVATPALNRTLNLCKRRDLGLNSAGEILSSQPSKIEWSAFSERLYSCQYVKSAERLEPDVKEAWRRACGRNPALTVASLILAQRTEIGGGERLCALTFRRLAEEDMASCQTLIDAFNGDYSVMDRLDDMSKWLAGEHPLLAQH